MCSFVSGLFSIAEIEDASDKEWEAAEKEDVNKIRYLYKAD